MKLLTSEDLIAAGYDPGPAFKAMFEKIDEYEARGISDKKYALVTSTRFGPGHRHLDDLVYDPVLDEDVWSNRFLYGMRDRAHAHLADQGDGNHFAYMAFASG